MKGFANWRPDQSLCIFSIVDFFELSRTLLAGDELARVLC